MAAKGKSRQWTRLGISFPVFARGSNGEGREFVEFATALNVSAGGMLLAVRRPLPVSHLQLEIPTAPGLGPASSGRSMQADTVWVEARDRFTLLGLRFTKPLDVKAEA